MGTRSWISGIGPHKGAFVVLALGLVALSACAQDVRPSIDVGAESVIAQRPVAQSPSYSMAATAPGPAPQTALSPAPQTEANPVTRTMQRTVGFLPGLIGRVPQTTLPAREAACRKRLKRMGVRFETAEPINDGGGCRVRWPLKVSGFSGGIKLQPTATLTCAMAEATAKWVKKELAPAARTRYFSGIDTIRQGSSYSCRRIAGTGTWSAHSSGNALDIMEITLNNGREVDVRKPGLFAFRQRGLLNSVRSDACPYFNTVLGPGFNRAHRDHFHFDLMQRSSGRRVCK